MQSQGALSPLALDYNKLYSMETLCQDNAPLLLRSPESLSLRVAVYDRDQGRPPPDCAARCVCNPHTWRMFAFKFNERRIPNAYGSLQKSRLTFFAAPRIFLY
jgi:hypothetical protein